MDRLWILAFAGLMVAVHRFGMGCCGAHGHGDRTGCGERPEAGDKSKRTAA